MSPHANVLVALAGDDGDGRLLEYAQELARQGLVARWDFAHVCDGQACPEPRHRALRQRVDGFFGDTPPTGDRLHVVRGAVIDCLLELVSQHQVDLLLMGASSGDNVRRSLARRLATKAPCSLWLVPRENRGELKRILCPIDFSPCSAEALRAAAGLAAISDGECLALHIQRDDLESFEEEDAGAGRHTLPEFVHDVDCRGVRIAALVETDASVPSAILRQARSQQSDLIVMGARGCSRSRSILLGSEVEAVLVAATLPLLVIKADRRSEVLAALLQHAH
jgi:nucleotide-binding universal stress UspA family protein